MTDATQPDRLAEIDAEMKATAASRAAEIRDKLKQLARLKATIAASKRRFSLRNFTAWRNAQKAAQHVAVDVAVGQREQ